MHPLEEHAKLSEIKVLELAIEDAVERAYGQAHTNPDYVEQQMTKVQIWIKEIVRRRKEDSSEK